VTKNRPLTHTETEKWPGSLEIIKMDVNYANSIREGIKKIIERSGRFTFSSILFGK
jgi:hypothetical protein